MAFKQPAVFQNAEIHLQTCFEKKSGTWAKPETQISNVKKQRTETVWVSLLHECRRNDQHVKFRYCIESLFLTVMGEKKLLWHYVSSILCNMVQEAESLCAFLEWYSKAFLKVSSKVMIDPYIVRAWLAGIISKTEMENKEWEKRCQFLSRWKISGTAQVAAYLYVVFSAAFNVLQWRGSAIPNTVCRWHNGFKLVFISLWWRWTL